MCKPSGRSNPRGRITSVGGHMAGRAPTRSPRAGPPRARRLASLLAVLAASLRAGLTYSPSAYPGRVTLIRTAARPDTFRASNRDDKRDPTWGWDAVARGGVDVHHVPGNHMSLLQDPHV